MATGVFDFGGQLQGHTITAGQPLMRIHQIDRSPLWFGPVPGGPPANRFDAPEGQYRTLYAAMGLTGAYVETVLHRPVGRLVRRAFVEARAVSILRPQRDLTLAALHGPGLLFHKAPQAISAADDYPTSRAFAAALFEQFPQLDGLAYRSSHNDDELCVALFDRVAPDDLAVGDMTPLSTLPETVDTIMAQHGAAFDTSGPLPALKTLDAQGKTRV